MGGGIIVYKDGLYLDDEPLKMITEIYLAHLSGMVPGGNIAKA